ncbi:MAG: hypothetical protein RIT81_43275 [Deltaproteobacteria bacterium]
MEEGVLDPEDVDEPDLHEGLRGVGKLEHDLAIFIEPLQVMNTRKWFGAAELRLDVVVVHGGEAEDRFHPTTLRFPQVRDGDDLSTGPNGLMVFLGRPDHFLHVSFMLSRDTKDSDDLAEILRKGAGAPELADAVTGLAALTAAAPPAAAIQAALKGALVVGDLAYKYVRQVSPTCLGLYRASWLGARDKYGIGKHPREGFELQRDFRFQYEIALNV